MEITEGKIIINGQEQSPSIVSKARYALGLKKVKPVNKRTCSPEYCETLVKAMGKYYKVPKEKVEKAKRSKIYLA